MFGGLLGLGALVFEVGDFIISAIVRYVSTPEGAADFADIQRALTGVGWLNPADVDEGETPQTPAQTVDEIISGENTPASVSGARRVIRNRGGGVVGEVVD